MATAHLERVVNGYALIVCGQRVGPKFRSPAEALDFIRDYLFGTAQ